MIHKILNKRNIDKKYIHRFKNCCRPMIYNNGTGEIIDTWRGGTCFVIKWAYGLRKRYFVITALHVISNRLTKIIDSDSLDQIRILKRKEQNLKRRLTEEDWVSVIAYHPIPNVEEFIDIFNDEDVSDVAIFEVDSEAFDGDVDVFKVNPKYIGCDNSQVEQERDIQNSFDFFVTGYPEAANTIDYDSESIVLAQNSLICKRANASDNGALTEVRVIFPNPSPFPINGLSGSPVFSAYSGVTKLCGMVVRGGGSHNNIIRFLRISTIMPLILCAAIGSEKIMREEFKKRREKTRRGK